MGSSDEAKIQAEIVQALQAMGVYCFAVPNELGGSGRAAMLRVMKHKAMGLRSGVSDLVVMLPWRVIFLEVKTKTGRQSENQVEFNKICQKLGHDYFVARSAKDAVDIITRYMQ